MTDSTPLETYRTRIEAELRENILPFWMANSLDEVHGGFYGEVSNDLTVDRDAPKGALLTARILWTFAAAYRRYQEAAYLAMARRAYTTLLATFWDPVHGGLYWRVAADGAPLATHKQIYGQAFGIYAMAEYSAATGKREPLDRAIALYRALEAHSHDPEGGYLEALTRAWEPKADMRLSDEDMNAKKSMNTHLHVLEAYTNLLRIWDDATLRRRHAALLDVMLNHIVDPATAHMELFFDEDWTPKSDHVSFGHDIEASWLLVEAAEVLGDSQRQGRVREIAVRMAQAVYEEGRDDDGAVLYEASPNEGIINAEKQWWPQAEAAVGFLNAYQLSGQRHFLKAALAAWDFIERYLVDQEHGGWFRYVTRDHALGTEDAAKISFWKCPYHNARACMELIDRLAAVR